MQPTPAAPKSPFLQAYSDRLVDLIGLLRQNNEQLYNLENKLFGPHPEIPEKNSDPPPANGLITAFDIQIGTIYALLQKQGARIAHLAELA